MAEMTREEVLWNALYEIWTKTDDKRISKIALEALNWKFWELKPTPNSREIP